MKEYYISEIIKVYTSTLSAYTESYESIEKGTYGHVYAKYLSLIYSELALENYLSSQHVNNRIKYVESNLNDPVNHAAFIQFIRFIENEHITTEIIPPSNLTTNWNLMYYCNLLISNNDRNAELFRIKKILSKRIYNDLIWDSTLNCSQQYSLFSLFILSVLFIKLGRSRSYLSKMVNKHCELVFKENPNWFGRGRNQLFGDTLFIAVGFINYDILTDANRVIYDNTLAKTLDTYKNIGYIPFIKTKISPPFRDSSHEKNSGWYAYNSYIDYFFFSYYILNNVINLKSNLYKANNKINSEMLSEMLYAMNLKSNFPIKRIGNPFILKNKCCIHIAPGSLSNITLKYDGNCLSEEDGNDGLIKRLFKLIRFSLNIYGKVFIFSLYPLYFDIIY